MPVRAELLRRLTGTGVTSRRLDVDGMVGCLYLPAGPGPFPGVIVLNGSGGGMNRLIAPLLASRGYAVLALAYFAVEGLPATLDDIPLEYFGRAFQWFQNQQEVDRGFIGVAGVSRGGELALLLGAMFPAVRAVVGYVPSGVVHGGLSMRGAAWLKDGKPIDWLQRANLCTDADSVDWEAPSVSTAPHFESSLRDADAVARSTIPVERINGPVLLISGRDDAMWPSTAMSEIAMQRLAKHRHPYSFVHLAYPDAGHAIMPPFIPTTTRSSFHEILKAEFLFGGSASGDAHACMDSWPRLLAFLKDAVGSATNQGLQLDTEHFR